MGAIKGMSEFHHLPRLGPEFCPIYVLMPDHLHFIWMGLRLNGDQRNAMKFLRKHLSSALRPPWTKGDFELQKQSHDSVLKEKDRRRGAFEKSCFLHFRQSPAEGLGKTPA